MPEKASLTLEESGDLNVNIGYGNGACIGGNGNSPEDGESSGRVIINKGNISIHSQFASGIGGGSSTNETYKKGGNGGNVTINGGKVSIYTSHTAIGGGRSNVRGERPNGGNITIRGGTLRWGNTIGTGKLGTITIDGGSANGSMDAEPKNSSKTNLYRTEVDLTSVYGKNSLVTNARINGYDYSMNDIYTDGDGKVYLYLPENTGTQKTVASFDSDNYAGRVTSTGPNILKKMIPLSVEVGTVTSDSASLKVEAKSGNEIYYLAGSEAFSEGSEIEAAAGAQSKTMSRESDNIEISGLTEDTQYTYYLTAKDGDEYSNVIPVRFTTSKIKLQFRDSGVEEGTLVAGGNYGQKLSGINPSPSSGCRVLGKNGIEVKGSWKFNDHQFI